MPKRASKVITILLCFLFLLEQSGFAQVAAQLDIASHLTAMRSTFVQDKFRPLHLRYLQYNPQQDTFRLLLDKGDTKALSDASIEETSKTLLRYFLVGITLPNDSFWVNLRPDSPDNIIDPLLAETDIGKVLLENDLQLKRDTAQATSPQTPEGKEYWNKLYQKAGELFGNENITIPTLTRPWIVPDEIIVRETTDSAYVYKATLKVMLEQDYLKDSATYKFDDPRLKSLNEYSSQLIRELIIPKLTKEVNSAKRYASLRQVYYSLVMAQWFKVRFAGKDGQYADQINTKNLANLTSKEPYSKDTYFKEYQKSFKDGEYNIKESAYSVFGQVIRSYFSGGMVVMAPEFDQALTSPAAVAGAKVVMKAPAAPDVGDTVVGISVDKQGNPAIGKPAAPIVTPAQLTPEQQELRRRAEEVLGRAITDEEYAAVQRAHDVGQGHFLGQQNPDGTFEKNENPDLAFTAAEIAEKARLLAQAGFTREERRRLMEFGVAGNREETPPPAGLFRQAFEKGKAQVVRLRAKRVLEFQSVAGGATPSSWKVDKITPMVYGVNGQRTFLVALNLQGTACDVVVSTGKTGCITDVFLGSVSRVSPFVQFFQKVHSKGYVPELTRDFVRVEGERDIAVDIKRVLNQNDEFKAAKENNNYPLSGMVTRNGLVNFDILSAPSGSVILRPLVQLMQRNETIRNAVRHLLGLRSSQDVSLMSDVLCVNMKVAAEGGHYRRQDNAIFLKVDNGSVDAATFIHEFGHHVFNTLSPEKRQNVIRHFSVKFNAMIQIMREPLYRHYAFDIAFFGMIPSGLVDEVLAYTLERLVAGESPMRFGITAADVNFLKQEGLLPKDFESDISAEVASEGRIDDLKTEAQRIVMEDIKEMMKQFAEMPEEVVQYLEAEQLEAQKARQWDEAFLEQLRLAISSLHLDLAKIDFQKISSFELNALVAEALSALAKIDKDILTANGSLPYDAAPLEFSDALKKLFQDAVPLEAAPIDKTVHMPLPELTLALERGKIAASENSIVVMQKPSERLLQLLPLRSTLVLEPQKPFKITYWGPIEIYFYTEQDNPRVQAVAILSFEDLQKEYPKLAENVVTHEGYFMVLLGNRSAIMHFRVGEPIVLGRASPTDNIFKFNDFVSRAHVSVQATGENQITLIDLGSTNGTSLRYVAGIEISDELRATLGRERAELRRKAEEFFKQLQQINQGVLIDQRKIQEFNVLLNRIQKWGAPKLVNMNGNGKNGGHMKELGLRNPLDADALVDLSGRHFEFEQQAAVVSLIDVYGVKARVVSADLGDIGAYHFYSPQYGLVIVVNSEMSLEIQEEGKFHEARETFWIGNGFSQPAAHVIASAEQSQRPEFLNAQGLSNYHEASLQRLRAKGRLQQIIDEHERKEKTRQFHRQAVDDANESEESTPIDIAKLAQYEGRVYSRAKELATADETQPSESHTDKSAPKADAPLTAVEVATTNNSVTSTGNSQGNMGGIDFRNLPIVTQAMTNLSAGIGNLPVSRFNMSNLDSEWQQIEQLVNSGITPSGERIKEYLQASCYNGQVDQDKKRMVICISNILRLEEERVSPTEPVLRDILIVLESGQSAKELKEVFTGIKS